MSAGKEVVAGVGPACPLTQPPLPNLPPSFSRLALCTEEHPPLPKPEHIKRSNGHYHYNHNARERHKRKGPTLRKVSTVKETPELQGILAERLASMTGNIKDLYLR